MSRTSFVAATLTVIALVVASVLLLGPGPGRTSSVGPDAPEPGAASAAAADRSQGASGRTPGRTSPPASSASAGTSGPASTPGTQTSTGSTELEMEPEPGEDSDPADYHLPHQPAADPAGPLLMAAPHSVVADLTRSKLGKVVQVALTASKQGAADGVLRFYRSRLGRAGFVETAVPAVAGSTAAAFRQDGDRVVVTVSARNGTVSYSVFGILRSGRS